MRHILPTIAGPLIVIIAWAYAFLLEGAVLTETVFAWPGLGLYITQSLFAADLRAVLAATFVIGLAFTGLNLTAELVQGALDPRIRLR
jgi:peptide/nickel transport system permease protein